MRGHPRTRVAAVIALVVVAAAAVIFGAGDRGPTSVTTTSPSPSPTPGVRASPIDAPPDEQLLFVEHVGQGPVTTPPISAFVVAKADGSPRLERFEVGGYTLRDLLAVSPDGQRVAYWRSRGKPLSPPFELVLWDTGGSASRVLYRTDDQPEERALEAAPPLSPGGVAWSTREDQLVFTLASRAEGAAINTPPAAAQLLVLGLSGDSRPRELRRYAREFPLSPLYFDGRTIAGFRIVGAWQPPSPAEMAYEVLDAATGAVRSTTRSEVFQDLSVSASGQVAGLIRPFEQPGRSIRVWEAADFGAGVREIVESGVDSPVLRPGSSDLAFLVNGELRVFDLRTRKMRTVIRTNQGVRPIAFSRRGSHLLASTGGNRHAIVRAEGDSWPQAELGVVSAKISPIGWIPVATVVAPPPARSIARELPAVEAERVVGQRAREAVLALKTRDAAALAGLAHPTKGVRFSPYAYVVPGLQQRLTATEIGRAFVDTRVRRWGVYDGIGTPIELAFSDYFERFVYDRDFAAAPQIAFNRPIGVGNTIDNSAEAYPDAILVEHHFPDTPGRLDWDSLRLLFEQLDGRWYLVGIVHAQWTI